MLPCSCWCWDCSQWGRVLVPGGAKGRGHGTGRSENCQDQVDGGWTLTGSTSSLVRAGRHPNRNYSVDADKKPFQSIAQNNYRRQSVKSRSHSSSDSDYTNDSLGNISRREGSRRDDVSRTYDDSDASVSRILYLGSSDDVDSGSLVFAESGHERALTRAATRTVTVTQQPRAVDIYRPDMVEQQFDEVSLNSSRGSHQSNRHLKTRVSKTSSLDSSGRNSPKKVQFRQTSANYMSPADAARVAVDSLSSKGAEGRSSGGAVGTAEGKTSPKAATKVTSSWRPSLLFQREEPHEEETKRSGNIASSTGVVEKTGLSKLLSRVVEGSDARRANFEYVSPNSKESGLKVHLRSKNTADNIANRRSLQAQQIVQYIFGYIRVTYKCSREKKLEVDVLCVRKVPRYTSAIFGAMGDENDEDEKIPSLNYVSVEICLRSQKGKQFTHRIKKFRTGDVPIDDESFEPEFSHTTKELEGSTLVLSVSRRDNISCPSLAVGHALHTVSKKDVQTSGIQTATFPLKHGIVKQDAKGSVLIFLSCSHPISKAVDLSVDIRMVQHLDVSLLGITYGSPDFKTKPEIKMRLQILGSKKSLSKAQDFAWIELHNTARSNTHDDERSKDSSRKSGVVDKFGGWGAILSKSCYFTRQALESELKKFAVCFLVQVIGRNNYGPAAKKEVVLGNVILGPELLCAETAGIGMELSPPLTHWGQALNKRTSVEMLHRLHL